MVATVMNWKNYVPWEGDSVARRLGSCNKLETPTC